MTSWTLLPTSGGLLPPLPEVEWAGEERPRQVAIFPGQKIREKIKEIVNILWTLATPVRVVVIGQAESPLWSLVEAIDQRGIPVKKTFRIVLTPTKEGNGLNGYWVFIVVPGVLLQNNKK